MSARALKERAYSSFIKEGEKSENACVGVVKIIGIEDGFTAIKIVMIF